MTQNSTDLELVLKLGPSGEFLGVVGIHQAQTSTPELGIWIEENVNGYDYGRKLL